MMTSASNRPVLAELEKGVWNDAASQREDESIAAVSN
ncbi:MAG: hypothetical protein RLY14_2889 [Planctomycetota bacterium]|jgi:hypothetical protein